MSAQELPVYESKEDLSSRQYDYINSYFLPLTCAFGLLTSTCGILGSYKRDTSSNSSSMSSDFILINSLVDFFFLLTQFFVFTFRCGALCTFSYNYFPQFYQLYIFWFIGYSLVNSQALFGIYVSVGRLRLFGTKAQNNTSTSGYQLFIVYLICLFSSLVPNSFTNSIAFRVVEMAVFKPNNASTSQILYGIDFNSYFQNELMQTILLVVITVKDPMLYVVYCGVNVVVIVKFHKFLIKKKRLVSPSNLKVEITQSMSIISVTPASKATALPSSTKSPSSQNESNFTRLTVLICLAYLFGNLIDCFLSLASTYGFPYSTWAEGSLIILGNFSFYITHSIHFFIYYHYDKKFRTEFKKILNYLNKLLNRILAN